MITSFQVKSFLRYYQSAKTIYEIDSPFVFDFLKNILEDDRHYYVFDVVEDIRAVLNSDISVLPGIDYGAPSKTLRKERRVKDIAQKNAISPRVGYWLFKIINHFKPEVMLELGTSLGISSVYQAAAHFSGDLITVEGSTDLAAIAQHYFDQVGLANIHIINDSFESALQVILPDLPQLDYVFLDGHHIGEARLKYFAQIQEKLHEDSIVVFSDMYWSPDMLAAWQQLQALPSVSLSLDLYEIGILFFNPAISSPLHLALIEQKYKPWKMGFWR